MGTIAARDCLRVLQLTEQVASALMLAVSQGIELRQRNDQLTESQLAGGMKKTKAEVDEHFAFLEEDRPLEETLRAVTERIQQQGFDLES